MATDVDTTFQEFLSQKVNLDQEITKQARSSRNWLLDKINALPTKHSDFPQIYSEKNLHFGSFARRTKIRELDDIDLIIVIMALGTTYIEANGVIKLHVPDGIALRALCFDHTNQLNSRKVINKFVSHLSDIPQYQKAEVKRTGEAAVLSLASYSWSFDIVPAFFTAPDWFGRTYYVIPDGNGNWKKTDPRRDRDRIKGIAKDRGRVMLDALRLIKYWNARPTMPGMSSYLIECIVLNYYVSRAAGDYPYIEFRHLLKYIQSSVLFEVQDPKDIQGNINGLTWEERNRISERAAEDFDKVCRASNAEGSGDNKKAIELWGKVFGPAFPGYY